MEYVAYDQFHWCDDDHLEVPLTGTKKEVLEQYCFFKDSFPDRSIGLLKKSEFIKLKDSIKQRRI